MVAKQEKALKIAFKETASVTPPIQPPAPWAIVAQGALYPNPKSLRMNHADEGMKLIAQRNQTRSPRGSG